MLSPRCYTLNPRPQNYEPYRQRRKARPTLPKGAKHHRAQRSGRRQRRQDRKVKTPCKRTAQRQEIDPQISSKIMETPLNARVKTKKSMPKSHSKYWKRQVNAQSSVRNRSPYLIHSHANAKKPIPKSSKTMETAVNAQSKAKKSTICV